LNQLSPHIKISKLNSHHFTQLELPLSAKRFQHRRCREVGDLPQEYRLPPITPTNKNSVSRHSYSCSVWCGYCSQVCFFTGMCIVALFCYLGPHGR